MTSRTFSAVLNRGIRAAAAAQRAHVRAHAAQLRETERLKKAHAKADREAYLGNRQALAAQQTMEVNARVASIQSLLSSSLKLPSDVDLASLKRIALESDLDANPDNVVGDPPVESAYMPARLGWFRGVLPSARAKRAVDADQGFKRFSKAVEAYHDRARFRQSAFENLKVEVQANNDLLDDFSRLIDGLDVDALVTYAELLLSATPLPEGFPAEYRVAFVSDSQQAIIEFNVPRLEDAIPLEESFRYLKQSDEVVEKRRPAKACMSLYLEAFSQLPLVLLHRIFSSPRLKSVDVVVLSSFVSAVDPATGQPIRPCLLSVRTTRDQFAEIDLTKVEPAACLRRLGATVSRSPGELLAVKPVVEFNMVDSRFVMEEDILSRLDHRPNLMELSPGDFESLITNLFQSMGLETKLTQPSRDGGVDCVAFDKRPVLGGKVVVQAERYRNTVGVSAVRDLFGTMHNEGASKGILVTTSGFGKAAYTFANGKPMELLSGENLLYLLKEHANVDAKIEFAEDWRDPPNDY